MPVACSASGAVVTEASAGPPWVPAQYDGSCVTRSVPARSGKPALIGESMTATVMPDPVVRWWMSAMPVWVKYQKPFSRIGSSAAAADPAPAPRRPSRTRVLALRRVRSLI